MGKALQMIRRATGMETALDTRPYPNKYKVRVNIKISDHQIAKWEMITHANNKDHARDIVRGYLKDKLALNFEVTRKK